MPVKITREPASICKTDALIVVKATFTRVEEIKSSKVGIISHKKLKPLSLFFDSSRSSSISFLSSDLQFSLHYIRSYKLCSLINVGLSPLAVLDLFLFAKSGLDFVLDSCSLTYISMLLILRSFFLCRFF